MSEENREMDSVLVDGSDVGTTESNVDYDGMDGIAGMNGRDRADGGY